jgi:hypothetical protein
MHNRARMRASNKLVREWLLENGFDDIWFKPHSVRHDYVFTQHGNYLATDLWNLFDGIAWGKGECYFLQMKTNVWAKEEHIRFFLLRHKAKVLVFNVTNKPKKANGKWTVFVREYPK